MTDIKLQQHFQSENAHSGSVFGLPDKVLIFDLRQKNDNAETKT